MTILEAARRYACARVKMRAWLSRNSPTKKIFEVEHPIDQQAGDKASPKLGYGRKRANWKERV